ncbi:hypothetical protein ACUN9V_09520 [Salinicola sp. V024]|uniref:hypothetical protein n=1 Tax=Salinicola sp. V024 TaxID=3459609 RepID=UPI0040445A40
MDSSFWGAVAGASLTGIFTLIAGWVLFQQRLKWDVSYRQFEKIISIFSDAEYYYSQVEIYFRNEFFEYNDEPTFQTDYEFGDLLARIYKEEIALNDVIALNYMFMSKEFRQILGEFIKKMKDEQDNLDATLQDLQMNQDFRASELDRTHQELKTVRAKINLIRNHRTAISKEISLSLSPTYTPKKWLSSNVKYIKGVIKK